MKKQRALENMIRGKIKTSVEAWKNVLDRKKKRGEKIYIRNVEDQFRRANIGIIKEIQKVKNRENGGEEIVLL